MTSTLARVIMGMGTDTDTDTDTGMVTDTDTGTDTGTIPTTRKWMQNSRFINDCFQNPKDTGIERQKLLFKIIRLFP